MATDMRARRALALAAKNTEKYGDKSAIAGRSNIVTKYYSSGSASLDYMLGTGGIPGNAFTEVFGPPGIGKSTIFGYGILRSVQEAGGLTAIIATEPDVDEDWIERHGVNLDYNVVFRPDTGEECWELCRDLIYNHDVDYILWDSLAATSSAKAQNSEKPQAFGNAAMNSWGITNLAVRAWKNQVGVMFINQVRDDTKAKGLPLLKSPGGWAIEHLMKVRVQLKPGKDRYTIKAKSMESTAATHDLLVGREVRAVIVKDKAAEELGKQAAFDFYHIETDEFPFGFDWAKDLLNTAKVAGVITGAGWLNHESFPNGKLQGADKAIKHLRENPESVKKIRKDINAAMQQKERALAAAKTRAKKEAAS